MLTETERGDSDQNLRLGKLSRLKKYQLEQSLFTREESLAEDEIEPTKSEMYVKSS